jgi:sugar (pentulose or hexulose) kinase
MKGTISGLSFNHTRGDILLAILEGISFYFKEFLESPGAEAFGINKFIAGGGGSKSLKMDSGNIRYFKSNLW